jgi:hypothetical protein
MIVYTYVPAIRSVPVDDSWYAYQAELTYCEPPTPSAIALTDVALSVNRDPTLNAPPAAVFLANTAPVDVVVSLKLNRRSGVNVPVVSAGQDFFEAVTEYESLAASDKPAIVITPAVVESDFAPSNVPVPAVAVKVN